MIYEHGVKSSASTPAKGNLFDEDEGETLQYLNEVKADKFHQVTAKLLYASKRIKIDIDLAVSFLCTRVAAPTVGDEDKLKRVLSYLKGTKNMRRIIGMNGLGYVQTWIDVSYAVHRDT